MVSIIIPIYNVKNYLNKCIDSVLAQSYTDLEIILVDDGSIDGSALICEEYAKKDSRIRVIHKKNGGLSDARNVGTEIATGEWIYYLDSDDWIYPEAIKTLFDFAIKNNCPIVQGNLYYAYPDHLLYRTSTEKEKQNNILSTKDAIRELIINDRIKNFAWGKLYKSDFVKDILFPVGKFFEDSFWQHKIVDRCNRYGVVDTPLYYYRQRPDSISGTSSERLKDLVEGNKERMTFIVSHYPEFTPLMRKTYKRLYNQVYNSHKLSFRFKMLFQRAYSKFFVRDKYKKIIL